jgi:hypothetical protein
MMQPDYKFVVAIYLRGDDLDPTYVTSVLGVEPWRYQSKGEAKITSTNRKFVTKIGLWALVAKTESSDLSAHIEELSSKIGNNISALTKITGVEEAYLDVFVTLDADDDGGGTCEFQLDHENLQTLVRFGMPARFTVAVVKK